MTTDIHPDDACPECGAVAVCHGPLIVCDDCELLMLDDGQTPYERWLSSLRVGDRVRVRYLGCLQGGRAEVVSACVRRRGIDGYFEYDGPGLRLVSTLDSPLRGELLDDCWVVDAPNDLYARQAP